MDTLLQLFTVSFFLAIKSIRDLTIERKEFSKYLNQFCFLVGMIGVTLSWFNYLIPDVGFSGSENLFRLILGDIALVLFLFLTTSVIIYFKYRNVHKKKGRVTAKVAKILSIFLLILVICYTYFIITFAHY